MVRTGESIRGGLSQFSLDEKKRDCPLAKCLRRSYKGIVESCMPSPQVSNNSLYEEYP